MRKSTTPAGATVWVPSARVPNAPAMMAKPPPTARSLTCVVYAPERIFRELLVSLLAIRAGIEVVAEAGDVVNGKKACFPHRADLLLLVAYPPAEELLAAARGFVRANADGRVVVLHGPGARFEPPDWLGPRLAGTIDRSASLQSLWRLLDGLGGSEHAARSEGLRERLGGRSLSQRETEIFRYIGRGLTNSQMAARIGLSEHTIRTHRKRIAAKLGTEGKDLMRWAIIAAQSEP